ncbi:hypothetical protein [Cytobacillus depressus]|nr:hypothetical protein [Cytobacillus depressus]
MKEQKRDHENARDEQTDEQRLIREFADPNSKQPVPQPKDFEDIEY